MKKQFPTIIIFSAHPDDAVVAMGGTMAKLAKEGYDVINVVFSCSQQNHWWLRQVYTCDMVMAECIKAGTLLGCRKTILLGTEKNPLLNSTLAFQFRKQIKALVEQHKPERIYTHLADGGKDSEHVRAAQLVESVLRDIRYQGEFLRFSVWSLDLRRKVLPQLLVDISGTFIKKRQAVRLFRSRSFRTLQLWPMAVIRNWKNGLYIGKPFAELVYITPIELC